VGKIKTELRCRKSGVLAMNCSHRPVAGRERRRYTGDGRLTEPWLQMRSQARRDLSRRDFRAEQDLSAFAGPFHFQRLPAFFH